MPIRTPDRYRLYSLLLALTLFSTGISFAQENGQSFQKSYQNGTQFYQASNWHAAASEFRSAQESASSLDDWSRALYWVILSELAYTDYGSAIRDMDELERKAPNSTYTKDMAYHRGRVYFNQGYFDDALILFRNYIDYASDTDRETEDRKAAAYFWMGECLYSMGQYDEALSFYNYVIEKYPESPKNDASVYRVDLVKQKKIEAELLALLQWSHEESLRTKEDYQRQIRAYEYMLNQYQKLIDDFTAVLEGQIQENERITAETLQSIYDRLLERARQLNGELDVMIRDYNGGGS